MKKNEKGFSVVEILIVLVVVSLIGGAGWYVYQNKNKANTQATEQPINQETKKENQARDYIENKPKYV